MGTTVWGWPDQSGTEERGESGDEPRTRELSLDGRDAKSCCLALDRPLVPRTREESSSSLLLYSLCRWDRTVRAGVGVRSESSLFFLFLGVVSRTGTRRVNSASWG